MRQPAPPRGAPASDAPESLSSSTADATPRQLWQDLWARLADGARSARHPFHLAVVATSDNGTPDQRTVVLRDVDATAHRLVFHTDVRSAKARILDSCAKISWLFYDRASKLQLRMAGDAEVLRDGEHWESRWRASRPSSRACYVHEHGPGTPLTAPLAYGPVGGVGADALAMLTADGCRNFAVVVTTITAVDWLLLSHQGHRRLRFRVNAMGFDSQWIAP